VNKFAQEILDCLRIDPEKTACQILSGRQYSGGEISELTKHLITSLRALPPKRLIAHACFNPIQTVIADLALMGSGHVALPIPLEFTDPQLAHMLETVDCCLVDNQQAAQRIKNICPKLATFLIDDTIDVGAFSKTDHGFPEGVIKIIHSSGTTSQPKGVLIKELALARIVGQMRVHLEQLGPLRYFSFVPLSLLIEQINAIYLTLFTKGTLVLLPEGTPPYSGGNADPAHYLKMVLQSGCNFQMLPSALIQELYALSINDNYEPLKNAFLITGGAPIPSAMLKTLWEKGFKFFEGYGLSETTSVTAWNTPEYVRLGSVGRPFPFNDVKISRGGEIRIKGPTLFAGYRSTDVSACSFDDEGYLQTGDIGEIDEDGYLWVRGRQKNIIALSTGRKVSPEWVENTYKQSRHIKEMFAFGDGHKSPVAVVIPAGDIVNSEVINDELSNFACELPEFARVRHFMIVNRTELFFTLTGRPRRREIWEKFREDFANGRNIHTAF
jgi:long-chain acyl-CoA synthetase